MPWIDELTAAVRGRQVTRLRYLRNPDSTGPRTIQPHALFQTSTGELRLDAIQLDGPSSEPTFPAWRSFDLTYIADLELLPETFDCDPSFNPENPHKYRRMVTRCGEP
ncbi:MAG TPA: WYL domain-containing protein [Mycobacteriales bacterium]|jgi:hypothetical protein|nr:WYL domain-containing protein [Mycobacteriales bacterium]